MLGLSSLKTDDRFKTNAARVANRDALIPLLEAETEKRSSRDLLAALEAAGVPAGPVNRLDQVFADPQVVARRLRQELQRADGTSAPTVRGPIVMDGEPCVAKAPSPGLGEHTSNILELLAVENDPWTAFAEAE